MSTGSGLALLRAALSQSTVLVFARPRTGLVEPPASSHPRRVARRCPKGSIRSDIPGACLPKGQLFLRSLARHELSFRFVGPRSGGLSHRVTGHDWREICDRDTLCQQRSLEA